MVCRVGKAPDACQLLGMGPASWLLETSMWVMLVRPVVQLLGRHPVRLLLFTCIRCCSSDLQFSAFTSPLRCSSGSIAKSSLTGAKQGYSVR